MFNAHSAAGVAQTVFYVPAVLTAAVLLFRRHSSPRMAWLSLFLFSIVRVAGGIVLALHENKPSTIGLIIAAIIFEGAGVIPLMLTLVGFLRIIQALDFDKSRAFQLSIASMRVLFLFGVSLIVSGSVLIGNYKNPGLVSTGTRLVRAGYAIVVVVLAVIAGFGGFLWSQTRSLHRSSIRILQGLSLSVPFLVVRLAYACLTVFSTSIKWNALDGSIVALVCMHSLMEYIAVIICLGVGFTIPPLTASKKQSLSPQQV